MTEFKINLVQIITTGACIQGLIYCFLLLRKTENRIANKYLALLLFSLVQTLFTTIILDFRLYDKFPALHWLPFTSTFWIGPSFFFYILHLINPERQFQRKDLWHFLPIILNYLHSIYHIVYGRNFPFPLFHNFTEAIASYALISMLIYTYLSYKKIRLYQKEVLNLLSNVDKLMLQWIRRMILILSVVFVFIALFKVVDYKELIDFSIESSEGYLFPYKFIIQLVMSITIYWLSIEGYIQIQTARFPSSEGVEDEELDMIKVREKLVKSMEVNQLFLDPLLGLEQLSSHTGVPMRDISRTLNRSMGKNFYYFVNEYRVKEVKKRLMDPTYSHLKILGIAFDCGFNSKATFNRMFKEVTGKSPRNFR